MNIVVATLNAKYIHTSLALRYLKTFCAGEFDVQIAEFTIKDPAMAISADLFARKPDVIGFSCYIWNIEETIVVIDMLRKVLPDAKIVLGGPEVSYDTAHWMERLPAVDFIVMGEGEETFPLAGELIPIARGDLVEEADRQCRIAVRACGRHGSDREAIDERRALNDAVLRENPLLMSLRHDAAAVLVSDQYIVERRQDARRGRCFRVGPRRLRQVEELAAILVAKADELGP